MKTISILIPCYNEEENVEPIARAVIDTITRELPRYDYELIFIDNDSRDRTRPILRRMCAENPKIKAIFNARNFGQFNSPYYGILQATGDCVISMVADFQDPVELIPQYVHAWEEGYKIVIGIKTSSRENRIMYWLRGCYYKIIHKLSDVEQIEHFTGSGLYDRSFVEVLRKLDDPTPFLRGIVAELGFKRKEIPYEQPKRRAGKTSNNFYRLYDAAMLSFTSYTKAGLRMATFVGAVSCLLSFIVAIVYLIMKLVWWDRFVAGMTPMLLGMLFLGSVQIFFIGIIGEYVLAINQRVMRRPLVIEEERINFTGGTASAAECAGAAEQAAEEIVAAEAEQAAEAVVRPVADQAEGEAAPPEAGQTAEETVAVEEDQEAEQAVCAAVLAGPGKEREPAASVWQDDAQGPEWQQRFEVPASSRPSKKAGKRKGDKHGRS